MWGELFMKTYFNNNNFGHVSFDKWIILYKHFIHIISFNTNNIPLRLLFLERKLSFGEIKYIT